MVLEIFLSLWETLLWVFIVLGKKKKPEIMIYYPVAFLTKDAWLSF